MSKFSSNLHSSGGFKIFSKEIPVEWDILVDASDECLIGKARGFAELPVEWDVLAVASDECLEGRAPGFVERERIRDKPGLVLWRLWNDELGELGAFEVRKLGPKRSQITFYGLGFQGKESNEKWQFKKEHIHRVIDSYFFMLSQENIFQSEEADKQEEKPTNSEEYSEELISNVELRKKAKALGIRPDRLERWINEIDSKKNGLTQLEMTEKYGKCLRVIAGDFHDMRKKNYLPKDCI